MLRVVLVDDERCVLEELEYLLQERAKIVGKFNNPLEAVENIVDLAPDAVFLDMEMPGLSGLDAASEILAILPEVAILFVTAHGHYAVDAFEMNAVDYLIKPVQLDRLDNALERIKKRLSLLSMNRRETVNVWNGRQLAVIPVEQIACCFLQKGKRTVFVVAEGQMYQTTGGLAHFTKKVGLGRLIRCHRSYYINPGLITRMEPGEGEQLFAYVQDFTEQIPISRSYRQEILNALQRVDR